MAQDALYDVAIHSKSPKMGRDAAPEIMRPPIDEGTT
jgi:hypothetical protein